MISKVVVFCFGTCVHDLMGVSGIPPTLQPSESKFWVAPPNLALQTKVGTYIGTWNDAFQKKKISRKLMQSHKNMSPVPSNMFNFNRFSLDGIPPLKINMSPRKGPSQSGNESSSNHPFSGIVSFFLVFFFLCCFPSPCYLVAWPWPEKKNGGKTGWIGSIASQNTLISYHIWTIGIQ